MIALENCLPSHPPFLTPSCELQIPSQRASEEANLAEEREHRTIHALANAKGKSNLGLAGKAILNCRMGS